MKVAILGTGMVGRSISARLSDLGHEVTLGTRNVEAKMISDKKDAYGNPPFKEWYEAHSSIGLKTFTDACSDAEVVINCTSGQASLEVLKQAGENSLANKVLIDVANPLDFSRGMPPTLDPVNTDSLGEQIQRNFPQVKVVKSLNTMNASVMVEPSRLKGEHNVFVCGNHEDVKNTTGELLVAFGWKRDQIIDLGDITRARGTEMVLPIWLSLYSVLGTAEFNFHIQRNP